MGPRRVQPCITLENWLRNNFCTWEQTYRQTDTQTDILTYIREIITKSCMQGTLLRLKTKVSKVVQIQSERFVL